jgi:transposase
MDTIKEEDLRRIVENFWLQNKERGKPFVVLHFEMMGMKRRTIYKYIKFVEEGHSPSRKPGSGRPRKILVPKQVDQLIDVSVGKVGVSFRKLGRQFGLDKNTIKLTLAYYGTYKKKRKEIPKSN